MDDRSLSKHPISIGCGTCPVCGGSNLFSSIACELPLLSNALFMDAASARTAATANFTMTLCRDCSHIFNTSFENDLISYTPSYDSSLEFSQLFVQFADRLSTRLSKAYVLPGNTIVEIGCGKGDFLKRICVASGAKGIGFDKSADDSCGESSSNIRFVQDYYQDAYADIRPNVVICRHVLEHVAEPVAFLRALRTHPGIGPETIFYFETPNALNMLREQRIWDLIYEHVSYFTPSSLCAAFQAAGFDVLGAGSSFDEQYLYVEAKPGPIRNPARASRIDEIENLVEEFEDIFRAKSRRWERYIFAHAPRETVVWGAGAKGISFVNLVPGAEQVRGLVDVNPRKWGRFAPKHGTRILAPQELCGEPLQSIIVANSIYTEEIASAAATLAPAAELVVA